MVNRVFTRGLDIAAAKTRRMTYRGLLTKAVIADYLAAERVIAWRQEYRVSS